jgi:hypothetical protein
MGLAKVSVDANVQVGARRIVLTNDDGGATVQSTLDLVTIVSPPRFSSIQLGSSQLELPSNKCWFYKS